MGGRHTSDEARVLRCFRQRDRAYVDMYDGVASCKHVYGTASRASRERVSCESAAFSRLMHEDFVVRFGRRSPM